MNKEEIINIIKKHGVWDGVGTILHLEEAIPFPNDLFAKQEILAIGYYKDSEDSEFNNLQLITIVDEDGGFVFMPIDDDGLERLKKQHKEVYDSLTAQLAEYVKDKEKKKYLIRVYIFDAKIGNLVNMCIDNGVFQLTKSNKGKDGLIAIYEGYVTKKCLYFFIGLGVSYFPLNNYEDFVIVCPNCGERIDDDMILLAYDENYFMGYNINCNREDCGCQMAKIEFLN